MSPTRDPKNPLPLLEAADAALASAWKAQARSLAPLLKRLGTAGFSRDAAIATRVPGGIVSHAPTLLRKAIRFEELFARPHAIAVVQTTRSLVTRTTQAILLPGTYVVRLRPTGRESLAFDFLDAKGGRVLGTYAHAKLQQQVPQGHSIHILGIDVELDPPDDILNPFRHLICLSFLRWRTCFTVPTWIWPK